ncbi:MAG: hypothetical protein ACTH31_14400, partial [Pseudoclavibacter sp.]
QSADLPGIAAAAGGAWGATVETPDELELAVAEGLEVVASGRSAVIAARLAPISRQPAEAAR